MIKLIYRIDLAHCSNLKNVFSVHWPKIFMHYCHMFCMLYNIETAIIITVVVLIQEVVKYTKRVLKMGDRSTYPSKGDTVECYYTGRLDSGKVFDTNVDDC